MLVLVLRLLLGSPRVHRDVGCVAVEPRLKGVGPSRAKTAVEPRLQGVGPSRVKTIIRIFAGGLPLLLKIMPVVGRIAEAVPACNCLLYTSPSPRD